MTMTTSLLISLALFSISQAGPAPGDRPGRKKIYLPDFPEGAAYVLGRLSNEELINVERSEPVYLAILTREGLDMSLRREAIAELAKIRKTAELTQVLDGIARADESDDRREGALTGLIQLLTTEAPAKLEKKRDRLIRLATTARRDLSRRAGYAALILADGEAESAWQLAEKSKGGLVDLLDGLPLIPDPRARGFLHARVSPLLDDSPNREVRQSAILALAFIPGREEKTFATLASFVRKNTERDAAIEALRHLPSDQWPKSGIPDLADSLVKYATGVPLEKRNTREFKRALQLGHELAIRLPLARGRKIREILGALGIRTVTIRVIPHLLLYDRIHIVAQARKPIEISLENPGVMPHNLVIVVPGALEEIGLAADRMIGNPVGRNGKKFVPDSDSVLHATPLVTPRNSATLTFVAPSATGEYPYLCTYPGHWVRMNGVLHVVEDIDAWIATNPDKALGSRPAARAFVRAWKPGDLADELGKLAIGRSLDRGKELFTAASCTACHRVRKVGGVIGPDLTEASKRLAPAEMLAEIIEPSKTINEQFQTSVLILNDGRIVSGIIKKQDAKTIHLLTNLRAKGQQIEIHRERVVAIRGSNTSTMPAGLLNTLTREEILDLLAYIRSDGDPRE